MFVWQGEDVDSFAPRLRLGKLPSEVHGWHERGRLARLRVPDTGVEIQGVKFEYKQRFNIEHLPWTTKQRSGGTMYSSYHEALDSFVKPGEFQLCRDIDYPDDDDCCTKKSTFKKVGGQKIGNSGTCTTREPVSLYF